MDIEQCQLLEFLGIQISLTLEPPELRTKFFSFLKKVEQKDITNLLGVHQYPWVPEWIQDLVLGYSDQLEFTAHLKW